MSWGSFDSKFVLFFVGGTGAVGFWHHWWYTQPSPHYLIDPSLCAPFDSSRAVLQEEHRRYPCSVLQGWDVVVRNYYVPIDLDGEKTDGRLLGLRGVWNRTVSSFKLLFADHQDKRLQNVSAQSLSSSSSVRVVDDVKAGRVSSSTWPVGTQKYSSMVLEPSGQADGTPLDENPHTILRKGEERLYSPTSILRSLVDTATDQTVIRCDPLAPCTVTTKRSRGEGGENELTVSIPNCANRGTSLEVPYLRTMLSSLAWLPLHPPPLHIGILGVGGGAMTAFLLRYAGKAIHRMDLVDVEPMCFASALNDLGLSTSLKEEDVVVMEGCTRQEESNRRLPLVEKYRAGVPLSALGSGRWESGVHLYSMDATEFLHHAAESAMKRVSSLPPVDSSRSSGCTDVPLVSCGSETPLGTSLHRNSASNAVKEKGTKKERRGWHFFRSPTPSPPNAAHGTIPTFADDAGNTPGAATVGSLPPKEQHSFTTIPAPDVPTTPSFSKSLFDVLMVDLYVGSLLSEQQVCPTFLNLCCANLSSNGVVAFNLPQRLPEFEELCKGVFGKNHVYAISVPSAANYIVIASNGRDGALSHRLRYRRAKEVTKWLQLPYPLEKELPSWWSFW